MQDQIETFYQENEKDLIPFLEQKDYLNLAKILGKKFCNFTEDDEKYINIFWDAAFNKSWIYLSDEMIIDQMGYKKSKDAIFNFVREMTNKYKVNIDYKEVDKNDDLVKHYRSCLNTSQKMPHNKKYHIITGSTFKKMLLRANTKKGDITCDYFIKIEALASASTQLFCKFAERQIKELESHQLKLTSLVNDVHALEKNQVFYLATTKNYAAQNRFKYGGVSSAKTLKSRLNTYNTGRAEGDLFYYCKLFMCNKYKVIEEGIGASLYQFKDKADSQKEMLHIRYDSLVEVVDFMCNTMDENINYINSKYKTYLQQIVEGEAIIPEEIILDEDKLQISTCSKKSKKIDLLHCDDDEINHIIEEIINKFAADQQIKYEFQNDKDSVSLELKWMDLDDYFIPYNLTKTAWREKFKNWYSLVKPEKIKIKGIKLL